MAMVGSCPLETVPTSIGCCAPNASRNAAKAAATHTSLFILTPQFKMQFEHRLILSILRRQLGKRSRIHNGSLSGDIECAIPAGRGHSHGARREGPISQQRKRDSDLRRRADASVDIG